MTGRPLGALAIVLDSGLSGAVLLGIELIDHLDVVQEFIPGDPGGFREAVVNPVDFVFMSHCMKIRVLLAWS